MKSITFHLALFVFFLSALFFAYAQQGWVWQNGGELHSVKFTSENVGCVCGDHGIIKKTTDGGQSWHLTDTGTNDYIWDICFFHSDSGWAVGQEGLISFTDDGGHRHGPFSAIIQAIC